MCTLLDGGCDGQARPSLAVRPATDEGPAGYGRAAHGGGDARLIHAESPTKFGEDVGGIGDILQSFFLSPSEPVAGWIVGAGPVLLYPSASDDALGGEKWGAGPTAVLLRQDHGWTYTTKTATTFGVNTESTYDWENEQWTVPVNVFVTQLLKLGPLPISLSLDGRDYAERPIGGPDWGLRFAITFLFPR